MYIFDSETRMLLKWKRTKSLREIVWVIAGVKRTLFLNIHISACAERVLHTKNFPALSVYYAAPAGDAEEDDGSYSLLKRLSGSGFSYT